VGVDTGGTFTDLVWVRGSERRIHKLSSTPSDPSRAILAGLWALRGKQPGPGLRVVHGTTVALNALLTGDVARTALVANHGLSDLIEIGRQDRLELYALEPSKVSALVPPELRFEVAQRAWPDPRGSARSLTQVRRPSRTELAQLRRRVERASPEAIAVCLLHAWADPSAEQRIAKALEPLGVPVTTSAGLLREYREFERFSTAVVNAALAPKLRHYLERLERALRGATLAVMQSDGGAIGAARAAREPARVLLSGPAGGVVGAAMAAGALGYPRMVGIDMGGTSTDVSFHGARGGLRLDAPRIAGHAVALPALDLHTIGCGGGSFLRRDRAGVLHVGPESAGADPGPVCHGGSDRLTVTDAHVLLGHLAEGSFLGGRLRLQHAAVERAFGRLSGPAARRRRVMARAALAVARSLMRRALGVMTMQRGEDPARLPLVAFGGAGGLHAAALAEALGFECAILPVDPGVLSAMGLALAPRACERSRTVLEPLERWNARDLSGLLEELEREAVAGLQAEGVRRSSIELTHQLDLRYAGQAFEIGVQLSVARATPRAARAAFERRHEELYGHRLEQGPVELVHARVRASERRVPTRAARPAPRPAPRSAVIGERLAVLGGAEPKLVRVIERSLLPPGAWFEGPAILQEYSATSLIPPRWRAQVLQAGHVRLSRQR
jgi:N-methylhydantoinase A